LKFWWLTNSNRLGKERRAVEALAREDSWFELTRWRFWKGCLCAEGVLLAHGQRYPVRLVYPDQFPEVPAWVEPQEDVRWSTHQYGKGALCLELRPDNWSAAASGADVLRSAHNLLVKEDPLGEGGETASSAHQIGQVQSYGWGANPVMLGAGCIERIRNNTATNVKAVRWLTEDRLLPLLVYDEVDRSRPQRPPSADSLYARVDLPVLVVYKTPPAGDADRAALVAATGVEAEFAEILKVMPFGVIIFCSGSDVTVFNLVGEDNYRRCIYVLPDSQGSRSVRTKAGAGKRVTIVGCGSVGSKIAESLLRSGIHKLTLVDGDVFLPGNLERHVLDWNSVGLRKVNALKRHLMTIVPGAEISTVDDNLNWQRSSKTHAWQVATLSESDMIVDATGDPASGLFLAAVAEANGKPFVTAEVFAGGIGALVAMTMPDRDPPFVEARSTFLAWCEAQNVAPPPSGERGYEMLDEGEPVVADDAAVTITAGHAARVILDIADGNPSPNEDAWLLLGYSNHWLFDGHGHTIRLDVGKREAQPALEIDEDATAFVATLLEELTHETNAGE
jgi:hypothetical protein